MTRLHQAASPRRARKRRQSQPSPQPRLRSCPGRQYQRMPSRLRTRDAPRLSSEQCRLPLNDAGTMLGNNGEEQREACLDERPLNQPLAPKPRESNRKWHESPPPITSSPSLDHQVDRPRQRQQWPTLLRDAPSIRNPHQHPPKRPWARGQARTRPRRRNQQSAIRLRYICPCPKTATHADAAAKDYSRGRPP